VRGFLSEDATARQAQKALTFPLRYSMPLPVDLFVGLDTLFVKKEIDPRK